MFMKIIIKGWSSLLNQCHVWDVVGSRNCIRWLSPFWRFLAQTKDEIQCRSLLKVKNTFGVRNGTVSLVFSLLLVLTISFN